MNPYDTYEIADFLLDEEFVDWVRYPTRESDLFWQQWLLAHPVQANTAQDARYWLTNLIVDEQSLTDSAVRRALRQIHAQIPDDNILTAVYSNRSGLSNVWQTVATLVVAVGLYWYVASTQKNDVVLRENNFARPVSFKLPDGSEVVLASKSRVLFPASFSAQARVVTLTGEASFNLVLQPRRPLVVQAGNVSVNVMGTRFRVRAWGNGTDVSVATVSGTATVSKVTGSAGPDPVAIVLTPNQQVMLSAKDGVFRKSLVETPVVINQKNQEIDFVFDKTPLANVFDRLQTAHGIRIDFDREKLAHCILTARLTDEPFYEKLNKICQAIGGTHETVGTAIVIHAEGCSP